ncbi:hypothetical protein OAB00_00660 [Akkermansiaceae bacterium]|nr:hypothetical protein [Akkermansiaceae bacterium]
MGATIWIKSAEASDEELAEDLSVICKEMLSLDKACEKLGAVKWSELMDSSIIAADFGEELDPNTVDPMTLLNTISISKKAISEGMINIHKDSLAGLNNELDSAESTANTCYKRDELVRVLLMP